MTLLFLKKGYPKLITDTEIKKVRFRTTSKNRYIRMKGVSSDITYHPLLFWCHQKSPLYSLYKS